MTQNISAIPVKSYTQAFSFTSERFEGIQSVYLPPWVIHALDKRKQPVQVCSDLEYLRSILGDANFLFLLLVTNSLGRQN
jgi:hypothetical protein